MINGILNRKRLRRALRKWRDGWLTRFFDTRYGRELLVSNIGPRVLSMTIDCGDHVMSVSPADYIGMKVFRKGHFERDHVEGLLAILRERGWLRHDGVMLELGGNIGTQTVYFALSGAYRHIVTVEPDPRNFRLLAENIGQNGLDERVTLVASAAGDHEGQIDFYPHRNNHGKSSAIRSSGSAAPISVPVKPVMQILAETQIPPEAIGLVWMDIEGYEPVACRSMEPLMARKVPLYMEFTPAFYGEKQATEFRGHLARFYDDCLIFHEDRIIAAKVEELPVSGEQFDVLFHP